MSTASDTPQLRPMGIGDILDQAFTIYRKNFLTMAGGVAIISAPLTILSLLVTLLIQSNSATVASSDPFLNPGLTSNFTNLSLIYLWSFMSILLNSVAHMFMTGALTLIVSERYFGRSLTIKQAYQQTLQHKRALISSLFLMGLVFAPLLAIFFVPVILTPFMSFAAGSNIALLSILLCVECIGWPLALIVFLALYPRWLFSAPAIVLENLDGRAGLGRSWILVRGSFWRVLGITVVTYLLTFALLGGLTVAITFLANTLPSLVLRTALTAVLTTPLSILVTPFYIISVALLYYDLRIRKEGFDLQLMAQQLTATPPAITTT